MFEKAITKKTKYTNKTSKSPVTARTNFHKISRSPHHKHTERMQKRNLNKESVFGKLKDEEYELLNSYPCIVDKALRLKPKQKKETFKAIRELFQELTSERSSKNIDYLSNPTKLSAYIYYYLWWNLLRFVRLFNGLSLQIKEGDVIGDFGSGPLTLVLALWIAKPELREKKLTFYCVDISEKAMRIGEEIFQVLTSFTTKGIKIGKGEKKEENHKTKSNDRKQEIKWKIKRVVATFGTPLKEKLDFFFSANMFNEICWNNIKNLKVYGEKQAIIIDSYLKDSSSILIIEPGLPIGGKIISVFRKFFLQRDYSILAPCPHVNSCPLHERQTTGQIQMMERYSSKTGKTARHPYLTEESSLASARGKWCHFSFSTLNAPTNLLELSEKVHLAKKTASLSYLYCRKTKDDVRPNTDKKIKQETKTNNKIKIIVTSNIIKLKEESFGVYVCSSLGFLLLKTKSFTQIKTLKSGTYLSMDVNNISTSRDKKSGALIVELD